MTSEAQKRATKKYDQVNTRQIVLKLNTTNDADILTKLDAEKNRQGYIKKLIRDDIMGDGEILSVDAIRMLIQPIARKNKMGPIYLFGSYARGEANEDSDVDLFVENYDMGSLNHYLRLQEAFQKAIGKEVDLVESEALRDDTRSGRRFRRQLERDKIKIYG